MKNLIYVAMFAMVTLFSVSHIEAAQPKKECCDCPCETCSADSCKNNNCDCKCRK